MEPSATTPAPERYYGQEYAEGTVTQPKTLRERLRDYYSDGDFATVMNIDTQPLRYQFATPVGYETFSSYPGHKETRQPNPPQVVVLQPGQLKLCPAFEADLMIEALVKQMATRVTERKIEEGKYQQWQSTNWQDPVLQQSLIERIYQGKQDLVGEANMGIAQVEASIATQSQSVPTESVPTQDILAELDKQDKVDAPKRQPRPPRVEA